MTKEQVILIIKKEVLKKGYILKEHRSLTTESCYFTITSAVSEISSKGREIAFRISDHKSNPDCRMITFRFDKSTNDEKIRGFVSNRIKGLSNRIIF